MSELFFSRWAQNGKLTGRDKFIASCLFFHRHNANSPNSIPLFKKIRIIQKQTQFKFDNSYISFEIYVVF